MAKDKSNDNFGHTVREKKAIESKERRENYEPRMNMSIGEYYIYVTTVNPLKDRVKPRQRWYDGVLVGRDIYRNLPDYHEVVSILESRWLEVYKFSFKDMIAEVKARSDATYAAVRLAKPSDLVQIEDDKPLNVYELEVDENSSLLSWKYENDTRIRASIRSAVLKRIVYDEFAHVAESVSTGEFIDPDYDENELY